MGRTALAVGCLAALTAASCSDDETLDGARTHDSVEPADPGVDDAADDPHDPQAPSDDAAGTDPDDDVAAPHVSFGPWSLATATDGTFDPDGTPTIDVVVSNSDLAVAAGRRSEQDGTYAVIWISPDGVSWSRTETFGPGPVYIRTILAHSGGGFTAGGDDADSDTAVIWSSPDGRVWFRHPDAGGAFRAWDSIDPWTPSVADILTVGDDLVAVGDTSIDHSRAAMAWRSSDGGESWQPIDHDPAALSGHMGRRMHAVVADSGRVAAVGAAGYDAGVWVSDDSGSTWQNIDATDISGHGVQEMRDLTITQTGTLIAGGHEDPDGIVAVIWRSEDFGQTWERAEIELPTHGRSNVRAVAAVGDVVLAVGSSAGNGAVWASADEGRTWDLVNRDDPLFAGNEDDPVTIRDVAVHGERVIVAGNRHRGGALIWTTK